MADGQLSICHLQSATMLLALDTASRLISLALHDGTSLVAEQTWRTANPHTVELAPQVALLLRRTEVEPAQLRAIAVAIGPGSYTGLRIGLGLAKGLALAHQLPLIGVPTADILMRAQPPRELPAIALIHAGRGRILATRYHWHSGRWEAEGAGRVQSWAALADEINQPTYVCGEVDAAGETALGGLKGNVVLAAPADSLRRAGYLAEIGWERLRAGEIDDPARLAPVYGHTPEGAGA